jgi:hypothetical protein
LLNLFTGSLLRPAVFTAGFLFAENQVFFVFDCCFCTIFITIRHSPRRNLTLASSTMAFIGSGQREKKKYSCRLEKRG